MKQSFISRVTKWFSKQSSTADVRARGLDIAETNSQNYEHWSLVGIGDANTAFDQQSRKTTRDRSRYEVANNTHLRGMVNTKAQDVVGCGPFLQMGMGHQDIEHSWNAWAEEVRLSQKLIDLWGAGKLQDGEGIGLISENNNIEHEVSINFTVYEPDQMGNPDVQADTDTMYDGIRHQNGHPIAYYIYDRHPQDYSGFMNSVNPYEGKWYDASQVVHVFRKWRIGQLRGATELASALPLSAILRRYTMATLSSAELAASMSLWLETTGVPEDEPSIVKAFSHMPVVRNEVITAPMGWKISQLRAEQPVDTYDKFLRAIVTQMGRSIGMPAALTYGDSSDYNMASGRLDYQDYIRGIESERRVYLETECLEKIFRLWLRVYLAQRSGIGINNFSAAELRQRYAHQWTYQPIHHSDPEKQANADVKLFEAGLLTEKDLLYRRAKDPEQHRDEIRDQIKFRKQVGLPIPGIQPGMEVPSTNNRNKTNGQQQNGQTQSSAG